MAEYSKRPLGELVECFDAKRQPIKGPDRVAGPFPYYGASGVIDYVDGFLYSGLHLLVAEDGENLRTRKTPVAFLADGDFWVNNHAHVIVGNSKADTRFLSYAVGIADIASYLTGSTQPKLTQEAMLKVPVVAPPLPEQRAIAEVLGALDDKIESNRRVVELLHDLGDALLRRGLAKARGEQTTLPEGEFDDVLAIIETGKRPTGGVAGIENGVPSIGAESIVAAGNFDYSKTKFVPRDFYDSMTRGRLESGDVLLYKDGGTPGNFIPHVSMTLNGFPFEDAVINEHVFRLRVNAPYSQAFLYFWMRTPRMDYEMRLRGTGAAIPGLNSSNVKELPIPVLDEQRLESMSNSLNAAVEMIHNRALESRNLEILRDALLPALLSGRIRVPAAAELVEAS